MFVVDPAEGLARPVNAISASMLRICHRQQRRLLRSALEGLGLLCSSRASFVICMCTIVRERREWDMGVLLVP